MAESIDTTTEPVDRLDRLDLSTPDERFQRLSVRTSVTWQEHCVLRKLLGCCQLSVPREFKGTHGRPAAYLALPNAATSLQSVRISNWSTSEQGELIRDRPLSVASYELMGDDSIQGYPRGS